ncbi:MAG TPA: hydrogenase nickel incorporation protein HypB [Acidobacteriota bacterium]|nr:hydrogenase nickel incorporation protein HypB [Acidobacteriota bacterium]
MEGVKLIDIKEEVLAENKELADEIRENLASAGVCLVNLMSSPGSGKTSLILRSLDSLKDDHRISVIEGDIDSMVDAEAIAQQGVAVVQIRTGGFCHLNAAMVEKGLAQLDLERLDLVFLENVGNLVCPAECDTGANLNIAVLSVPEGDDKPLKYPLIFRICDALVVNKVDCSDYFDFNMETLVRRVRRLNETAPIFELSCKTGQGIEAWCRWLARKLVSRP